MGGGEEKGGGEGGKGEGGGEERGNRTGMATMIQTIILFQPETIHCLL